MEIIAAGIAAILGLLTIVEMWCEKDIPRDIGPYFLLYLLIFLWFIR